MFYNKSNTHTIPAVYRDYFKEFTHPLLGDTPVMVHQDILKSLRMVFDASTEPELMGAIFNINLMMKRSAVSFSFFHAGALVESMFFAGVPLKLIGKFFKPKK
jgi:hypothetical protein